VTGKRAAPERAPGDPLGLRFTDCEVGWIAFTIQALEADRIMGTDWADPFPAMMRWLERIAGGADTAVWSLNQEGSAVRLIFVAPADIAFNSDHHEHLLYMNESRQVWTLAAAPVERRAMVHEFYSEFRAFAETEYRPGEWEPALPPAEWMRFVTTEWRDEDGSRAGWHTNGDIEVDGKYSWNGEYLQLLRSPAVEAYLREDAGAQGVLPFTDPHLRHSFGIAPLRQTRTRRA
jgi:hypothetical protein